MVNIAPEFMQGSAAYVMSGIPTTFSERLPSYTVIGGTERLGRKGWAAVLLYPEPSLDDALPLGAEDGRAAVYRQLWECGFDFVVSLEPADTRADIGGLAAAFPFVRFVLLKERLNIGREINLAAAEIREAFFFVLRRGYQVIPAPLSPANSPLESPICAVPLIYDRDRRALPAGVAPAFSKGKRRDFLRTKRAVLLSGEKTLFPFGGMGLYHRERFIRLGGFDGTIESEYWQLMDFGMRCYAWGEEILGDKTLKLISSRDIPPCKIEFDGNYRRFYLKNLSPVFRFDAAYLPLRRFPHFLAKSGLSPASAWSEFAQARAWVSKNTYRWKLDSHTIVENWEHGAQCAHSAHCAEVFNDDDKGCAE